MKKSLGSGEVGWRAAAPIWANFMRSYVTENEGVTIPEDIVRLPIDPETGLLSYEPVFYEYFKEGNHPKDYSSLPVKIHQPKVLMEDFN
ncbi:MAG TPA: hypothetical protein HPP56_07020 [Nitrospirae bacterium]|nr:hypothetical protein [Nitrospirota bacterium]